MPVGKESMREVGADETSAARDQNRF
jgi:hypothetical protein